MTLKQLKDELENIYGFNLASRSRKRELVDARRIFSKLGYELNYNLRQIGEEINRKHCNIIYLLDSTDYVSNTHKKIHDKIVKKYSLLSQLYFTKTIKKIEKEISDKCDDETIKLIQEINKIITTWEAERINEFIETRLKPYNNLLKATNKQTPRQKIKGAQLKRKVKNSLLC